MIAHHLNDLLKNGAPHKFEFNKDQLEAFKLFSDEVCSPHILALPILDLPYSVNTDSAEYGLGYILF